MLLIECFLAVKKEVFFHKENCKNVSSVHRYPEKYVYVQWAASVEGDFQVDTLSHFLTIENEIIHVFLNILKNAQDKFIEKKTKDAKIEIKTLDLEDSVQIEIHDNGGGIAEAYSSF